jgi:hypothetical protein
LVQCKRVGKHYVKHKNGYYCDKHHDVKEVEKERRHSIENAYSMASTTSSNDE